jgi:general stress protein 26
MHMSVQLSQEVTELLRDPQTLKVLATVDERGVPHAVVKGSLSVNEDGDVQLLELLETSRTNRNLVRSIWHDRRVAILLKGQDGRSFQIKGLPIKAHVSGPVFQKHYSEVRARLGDVDLAAVWIIRPDEILDETPDVRRKEEQAARPTFTHLDRLVRA